MNQIQYWLAIVISITQFFLFSLLNAQSAQFSASDDESVILQGQGNVGALGEFLYELPINVLPVGNGFVPKLSIVYRSGLEDGLLGPGWAVGGLSTITRCHSQLDIDGYNHSPNLSEADMFCLDGQKLIAITGDYGADGTEYRTKKESYQRIISYGQHGNGPEGFIVWKKSGEIEEYGFSSDAIISTSSNSTALSWGISKVSDRYTNYITITYSSGDKTLTPASISYGGNLNAGIQHYRYIKFRYKARAYPSTYYQAGIKVEKNRILEAIQVTRELRDVWTYEFNYKNESGLKPTLSSVRKCLRSGGCSSVLSFEYEGSNSLGFAKSETVTNQFGSAEGVWHHVNAARIVADLNNNGLLDILGISSYLDVSVNYRNANGSFQEKAFNVGFKSEYDPRRDLLHLVDINNDGLPDIVTFLPRGVKVSLNSPNGFLESSYWLDNFNRANRWDWRTHVVQIADMNGDGLADIVGFFTDGTYVSYGSGTSFSKPVKVLPDFGSSSWTPQASIRLVADLNLDGYSDIVGFHPNGLYVSLGSADGPKPANLWTREFSTSKWPTSRHPQHLFDMNADGYLDIVSFRTNGVHVALGTGTGFSTPTLWLNDFIYPDWDPARDFFSFVDISGDQIPDFVAMRQGMIKVIEGQAAPIRNPNVFQARLDFVGQWHGINHPVYFEDWNGDGVRDILAFMDFGLQVAKSKGSEQRISRIKDGLGNEIRLKWAPIHDQRVHKGSNKAKFPLLDLNGSLYVVNEIEIGNGIGEFDKVSYRYEGAKFHTRGYGFLGFEKVVSYDHTQALRVEKTYSMDYKNLKAGQVESAQTYLDLKGINSNTGTLLNRTDIIINSKALDSERLRFQVYESEKTIINYDLRGFQTAKIQHKNLVDSFGNVYEMSVKTTDKHGTYDTLTRNVVLNDTENWLIGKVRKTTVIKTRNGLPPETRSSDFDYDEDTGALTYAWEEKGTREELLTKYVRDKNDFGHVDAVIKLWSLAYVGLSFNQVQHEYFYDERGFLNGEKNALGHESKYDVHLVWGVTETAIDPNGLKTVYHFNDWGQVEDTELPDGRYISTRSYRCTAQTDCPKLARTYSLRAESGSGIDYQYFDSRGRTVRTKTQGLKGEIVLEDEQYNARGLLERSSLPYYQGSPVYWVRHQYDALGRLKKITPPDNRYEEYDYIGLDKIARNAKGYEHRTINNALGETLEKIDSLGKKTKYEFNARGLLAKITDAENQIYTFGYDRLDRITKKSSPYLGLEENIYNGLGLLFESTNNKNQVTTINYDKLGRVTSRNYGTGRVDQVLEEYIWDRSRHGIGVLHQVSSGSYFETFEYDSLGRPFQTRYRLDQQAYLVSKTYDEYSRLQTVRYPTGFQYSHRYDEAGHLYAIEDERASILWELKEAYPDGTAKAFTHGGKINSSFLQKPQSLLIKDFSVKTGSKTHENWTYEYDAIGNVTARGDGFNVNETFDYDELNRLISTTTGPGKIHTYRYDAIGNFKERSDRGIYQYGRPSCGSTGRQTLSKLLINIDAPSHTPTHLTGKICYDANGNMTTGYGRSITYSPADKPIVMETKDWRVGVDYGPGQIRYKRSDLDKKTGDQTTTLYMGGSFEVVENKGRRQYRHYLPGDVVVTIDHQNKRKIQYLHKDPLGSVVGVSKDDGSYEKRRYDVWGSPVNELGILLGSSSLAAMPLWNPSETVSDGFTGHEHLGLSGLIHMNGRVYDPFVGRFLSPDPVLQVGNTQWFSGYNYVNNNPLGYTDPSGYIAVPSLSKAFRSMGKALANPGSWIRNSGKKLNRWVIQPQNQRQLVATAISVVAAAYNPFAGKGVYSSIYYAGSGFVSGYVASGGDIKTAAVRSASSAAFFGIGEAFTSLDGVGYEALKVVSHGAVGGISSVALGGSFQSGFTASAVSELFTVKGIYDRLGASNAPVTIGGYAYNYAISAVVGGTSSELTGGTFEDGAVWAAYGRLINEVAHSSRNPVPTMDDWLKEQAEVSAKLRELLHFDKWVYCPEHWKCGTLTIGPGSGTVTKRPTSFRKQTISNAWEGAKEGTKGGRLCPTCGKEVKTQPGQGRRDWDVDHQPPWSKRDLSNMNRKQVLEEYNRGTRLECPSCNRSRGAREL